MAIIGSHNEQGAYPIMAFQVSQTWTCPVAMEAIVYVIGAGGSGATVGSYYHAARNATGGGAGGCAVSRLTLAAQDYTVTIGTGGDDVTGHNADGETGGNSVFDNSGGTAISTMTGNGGVGGTQNTSAQSAAAGGTASGGNLMNNTGGTSGANDAAADQVSGGGGVNLYGSACNGVGAQALLAQGGTPHGNSNASTGSGADLNAQTQNAHLYKDQSIALSFFPNVITHSSGFYSDPSVSADPQGTQQIYSGNFNYTRAFGSSNNNSGLFAYSGPFCGGAGWRYDTGTADIYAQSGGVGAGGGAAMNTNASTEYAVSGNGGSGLILIFPIQLG